MKIKFSLFFVLAALISFLVPNIARADVATHKAALIGTWMHPKTKKVYTFNSDATYFVVNGMNAPDYVMEQGYWQMVQPTKAEVEEGPVTFTLILKMRKRTTEVNGRRVTKSVKRDSRHVAGMVTDMGPEAQQNGYYFDNLVLKRVE